MLFRSDKKNYNNIHGKWTTFGNYIILVFDSPKDNYVKTIAFYYRLIEDSIYASPIEASFASPFDSRGYVYQPGDEEFARSWEFLNALNYGGRGNNIKLKRGDTFKLEKSILLTND